MSIAKLRFMAVGLALVGSGLTISLLRAQQPPPPWVVGDVFVAIGSGKYEVRNKNGALKQTITSPVTPRKEFAGCWFDSLFNLYTADYYNTKVVRYEFAGSHAASVFADTDLQAPDGHSESIVMAVNGDVYVGHAGDGTASRQLLRYRSDGAFLASYTPMIESGGRGIDWIDLSTDQRTMYFTSAGRDIRTFHVPTNTTTVLTTLPSGGQAFAIRLLGPSFNGSDGLLVADNINIKQLDSTGAIVATYDYDPAGTNNDENAWQGMNLDPDGVHFWAVGFSTGRLFRFALGSGTPDLGPIQTAGAGNAMGLCVLGEPQTQVFSLNLSNSTGSTVFKDVTAKFGDPTATGENDFYSFSTWRIRVHIKANQSVVGAVTFTPQSTTLVCNPSDPNDFDCRFTQTPAQCVPFFRDPSAANPPGSLDPYRCGFYRLDLPACSAASPGTCPYDEPFIPGTDDSMTEYIINLTNPPQSVFDVSAYGPAPKGNPRLMRDPSRVAGNQFFIDATAAVIDWPAFGTGTTNDYSPVQRMPTIPGACAEIIKPEGGISSGSSIKIVLEVKTGPLVNGVCTGTGVEGAATAPYKITLAIAGTGGNPTLVIYCTTPGNSNACFEPVNGQPGRYQSNVNVDSSVIPPDTVNPYFFAVTSVNVPSDNTATQNPGIFPPVGRSYFVCPTGTNCGS